jgi:hypothetical protein
MAFGFSLTKQDHAAIEGVLGRSQGTNMIASIGDCGAEYRVGKSESVNETNAFRAA